MDDFGRILGSNQGGNKVLFRLLRIPDDGIERTGTIRWTTGNRVGTRISGKCTRTASAVMPDIPGTVSRWKTSLENLLTEFLLLSRGNVNDSISQ